MKNLILSFVAMSSISAFAQTVELNQVEAAIGIPAQRLSGIDYRSNVSFTYMSQGAGYNSVVYAANIELNKLNGYQNCFNYHSLYTFLDNRKGDLANGLNVKELALLIKQHCNP